MASSPKDVESTILTKPRFRPAELICQVPSCGSSLKQLRMYNQRCRICEHHHHAPEIDIDGQPMRFCHRCAALQPLVDFKVSQRSCIASLQRHKELKQQRMQVRIRMYKRSADGRVLLDADCLQGTRSQPAMVAS